MTIELSEILIVAVGQWPQIDPPDSSCWTLRIDNPFHENRHPPIECWHIVDVVAVVMDVLGLDIAIRESFDRYEWTTRSALVVEQPQKSEKLMMVPPIVGDNAQQSHAMDEVADCLMRSFGYTVLPVE